MRDVVDEVFNQTYTTTFSNGSVSSAAKSHVKASAARDDLKVTIPTAYGFMKPTNYWAYMHTCVGFPFNCNQTSSPTSPMSSARNVQGASASLGIPSIRSLRLIGSKPTYVPNITSNEWNMLNVRCLNKLKRSTVNYGVLFGELKTTVRMIQSAVKTLLAAWKALLRFDFKRVAKVLGVAKNSTKRLSLADAWLSYKYGWYPLVMDIYNSIQLFRTSAAKSPPLLSVHHKESLPFDVDTLLNLKALRTVGPAQWRGSAKCEITQKLFYTVSNPWLATLDQLGLINPASLTWELLPYSFVIDWLLPIGNFLSALSAGIGLDVFSGYRTSYVKYDIDVTFTSAHITGYYRSGQQERIKGSTVCFQRETLSGIPVVLPYWNPRLTVANTITSIALAHQRLR